MAYVTVSNGRMTTEQANQIRQALEEKGVALPCPRCGNLHFTLLEGFFNQPVSGDVITGPRENFVSSTSMVPSVVTACARCGFISQHSLGVLGLLPGFAQNAERYR